LQWVLWRSSICWLMLIFSNVLKNRMSAKL
jgi:hypothetical protein